MTATNYKELIVKQDNVDTCYLLSGSEVDGVQDKVGEGEAFLHQSRSQKAIKSKRLSSCTWLTQYFMYEATFLNKRNSLAMNEGKRTKDRGSKKQKGKKCRKERERRRKKRD